MRSRTSDHDEEVDVQMTPLIDCVFLLLVFFLVASVATSSGAALRTIPAAAASSSVRDRLQATTFISKASARAATAPSPAS